MQIAARARLNPPRTAARAGSAAVLLAALSVLAVVAGCGGGASEAPGAATAQADAAVLAADRRATALAAARVPSLVLPAAPTVDDPEAVEVGNELFHDPRLSASGQMSCGSCHVQMFGHADALKDAVRFHFERDRRAGTRSATWYRKADGSPDRAYNDLPLAHVNNLSTGAPFNGAYLPSEAELQDLLAFLSTLDDGDQLVPLPQR